jgi:hypothetical protein
VLPLDLADLARGLASSLRRTAGKNSFTLDALRVVVVKMKAWSWYLAILAVFAALTLSSCASQEGVAPNEAELQR